jgi:dienelactone hydrolase
MRICSRVAALGCIAASFFAGNVAAANLVPDRVSFDSLDLDPVTGAPVRISALLFRPEGSSGERRAAVIALHGCGGMYSIVKSRRNDLSLRHQAMAELLVGEGYVVLFPDSFRTRGRDEICTIENTLRTITQVNRRLDVLGALAYLQARYDVAPERIALLGWSHGASAVLSALNTRVPIVAARLERTPSMPYFRAGVAFYPGCYESLRAQAGYGLAAPLRLFIAGSDDWTSPRPCIELADRLAAAGEPVKITVYPDTYHGFDAPPAQPPLHLDVPNGVHPGQGVTVAPNPEARADAYVRLKAYLRAELSGLAQRFDDGESIAQRPARRAALRQ